MKHNKTFLFTVLAAFSISVLVGCNNQKEESSKETESSIQPISSTTIQPSSKEESSSVQPVSTISSEEDEEPQEYDPTEIGDIVKDWWTPKQFDESPFGIPSDASNGSGEASITEDFAFAGKCSLMFDVKTGNNNKGYVGTDLIEEPYFGEFDAKNGDIISVSLYVPNGCNVASLQLVVYPSSMNNPFEGDVINITDENVDDWIYTEVSFDSLDCLGAIRIVYTAVDSTDTLTFYADDICVTLGEETVKTGYEYNDESLYETYEDYFKVGTCLSASSLKNSEQRRLTKDNFNSITAENEAKPERVLDQAACQALADKSEVAITMKPFEQIYDFAEANGIGVRHHTFVWYSQTPSWFFTVDYAGGQQASRELMLKRMDNFMKATIEGINDRWPGLVYAIDVVNEAVGNGGAGYNKNNKWFDTIGEDFVYQAFKCAAKYKDDDQDLYYNDYDYDYNTSNCEFALNGFLKDAIDEGLVDGVGIQGHIDSDQSMDVIIDDAKMIKQKGLKCQITELDITVGNSDWNKQKEAYTRLITKILRANAAGETEINAIILWGTTDNVSWKSYQNPLLFTSNYEKKPCYYGFLEAINEVE